jgi:hypothetical protein
VSTKFNIITKNTYKEFYDKTIDIQIVENNLELKMVTFLDKFGNISLIEYDVDDIIIALSSVERHDPVYLLYLLVTLTDAVFLSENNYKNCIQIPLMNKLGIKKVEIETSTYEEFTKYFKENIKWAGDFDTESQFLNPNGQIDSYTNSIVSNYLIGQNSCNSMTKSMWEEPRKTDDYFELDEDFEIKKIIIKNQDFSSKNNITNK